MATSFRRPPQGPGHINADPQKDLPPDKVLVAGLEHRPFTDDEIQQAFDTFDLTKKHFVGANEIRHILKTIGEEAQDEEVDEMIRMCDSDGKGQVTYDEFYKMMTQPPPPPPVKVPKTKARQSSNAQTYLKRSQSAKEDALTAKTPSNQSVNAEQQAFRAGHVETLVRKLAGGLDKIKPSQIKKVYKRFQEIDEDGSGAIDYGEFCKALDMQEGAIAKQMFRVFDMDGSGSIELKEFIVVLSRYTSAAKTEKLKFAFMMFDEDGSGKIERDELIEMLSASFVVEGYSRDELELKADKVYEFLGLDDTKGIGYEDFLRIAQAKNGLIYPLEEVSYTLDQNIPAGGSRVSMNAAMEATGGL